MEKKFTPIILAIKRNKAEGKPMYFSRQFINLLKNSIPLEKLIGQYIELKKLSDHFVGLCPFHDDHNPSFTVFPGTQSFYCFGCKAGSKQVTQSSDHLAFLMSHLNLTFPQAVVKLAEITNTPLPNQANSPAYATGESKRTQAQQQPENSDPQIAKVSKDPISQQIFNLAAEFYHQQLFTEDANFALDYLTQQRDRSMDIIKQFKIGYAKGGRGLYNFLKNKGFSDDQLLQSKLIAKRNNRLLDYFFGKIILFPHFKNNNVIGFTIKDLGRYKSPVKLRLFSRNTFYNHNLLSDEHNEVILVEGESDLHSIVQFTDHKNVLALCGNQLTQLQLQKLISAKIKKVYLALDQDAAGKKATKNIAQKLSNAGITPCPLQYTCHKDIDLCIRYTKPQERKTAFEQLIIDADEKSTKVRKTKNQQTELNSQQQHPDTSNKTTQTNEPSNLQIIKELTKTISILLTTIYIILKNTKTYMKYRKNPQPKTPQYHKRPTFSIDQLPVYKSKEIVANYKTLLEQYQKTHGKKLKPVKRRQGKKRPPQHAHCQFCQAPAEYLSINDGHKQVYCKVCKHYSNYEKELKDVSIHCPHCDSTLVKMKKDTEKNGYLYYKCRNKNCSYFISNKNRQKHLSKKNKQQNLKKLHYIYRKAVIDITALHPDSPDKPKVDLANVRSSAHVIGLALTYRAFGHSTREISDLLLEIHGVDISHQTIKNYLDAAAYRLAPMVFNYPYDLSGILAADETYIRTLAKWNYLTLAFDPKKQIISALNVSEKRNLIGLAKAINHAVSKYPLDCLTENADFNPLVVTDGNPVYQLITQFLRQANVFINHKVVIGLENNDDQSTDFRNLKQIIERLNKNFKKYINKSEHFGACNGVLSTAVVFTAHYNFIRKNNQLNEKIPVTIDTINVQQKQPYRWARLLEHAQNFYQQVE